MIKVEHSFKLFQAIKHENKVMLNPPNMTHNIFNLDTDFVLPLKKFTRTIDEQERQFKEDKLSSSIKLLKLGGQDSQIGDLPQLKPGIFGTMDKEKLLPLLDRLKIFKHKF